MKGWRLKTKWGVALLCGAAAFLLMKVYFRSEQKKIRAQFEMTQAYVAKKFIAQGRKISAEDLSLQPIPLAYVQPTALHENDPLSGPNGIPLYKSRIGILKGEQITRSKLSDENSILSLTWILPPNQLAMTLKMEPDASVAGLIQPGDWVSVLAAMDSPSGLGEARAFEILPRVQIMALQDRLWDPTVGLPEKSRDKNPTNEYFLVTLSVNREEAVRLTLASGKCRLVLGLQSAINYEMKGSISAKFSQLYSQRGETP